MENGKHAYLIIAHNNFLILEKLIRLLDDPRNDIYVHINKKSKNFDLDHLKKLVKYSEITFIKRTNVKWGGYSYIKCIFSLLKAATAAEHDYYHFMSGVDLPLKSQDYIHDFFTQNAGKEFVHFDHSKIDLANIKRIKYYHILQGRPNKRFARGVLKVLNSCLLALEKLLKINRLRKQTFELQKGADWFSVTDSLARYILSQEAYVDKMFRLTGLGNEMFLQTIVWNSEYRWKLYKEEFDDNYLSCMRYVDWKRGKPYVWRSNDFDELINSEFLFARKFDTKIDFTIVDKIYDHIMESQQSGLQVTKA